MTKAERKIKRLMLLGLSRKDATIRALEQMLDDAEAVAENSARVQSCESKTLKRRVTIPRD